MQCKISLKKGTAVNLQLKHATGGHAQGGATCLYKHLGGAKALFCHVNHQVNGSARGDKTIQNFFHLGAMPPMPPSGTCLLQGDSDNS